MTFELLIYGVRRRLYLRFTSEPATTTTDRTTTATAGTTPIEALPPRAIGRIGGLTERCGDEHCLGGRFRHE
jgi:hypothetical protein